MECANDSVSRRLLILTRRAGESILIGTSIEILVVAIATPTVRLEILTRSDRDPESLQRVLVSCEADRRIAINDRIDLLVRFVRGRNVRLGVIAPADVIVLRSELSQARENSRS